ncbi:chemotaxis protein CheW [Tissierella sp. Yu-01]|uniref:chemotaxis protein CheW n=1 Tax=Tissierella sp. Yu-01 TaxID=3035694 RepID=UPI00240DFD31|nr:chemotaxis protein CheW [Tissierella sp. Yu-01]WFA07938.1 chemotaxis protein CheW [Tissierella sp. Yu-01]
MERFIIFSSNNQDFAVNISHVEKIIEFKTPNPIPESSDYLLGVIKYNDKILPVVNLSKKLYNVNSNYDENDKVIVIMWKDTYLGLAVDDIIGIRGYEDKQLEDAVMNTQISKEYVIGFIKAEEGITIVLDTDKIFNIEQENEILSSTEVEDYIIGDDE